MYKVPSDVNKLCRQWRPFCLVHYITSMVTMMVARSTAVCHGLSHDLRKKMEQCVNETQNKGTTASYTVEKIFSEEEIRDIS